MDILLVALAFPAMVAVGIIALVLSPVWLPIYRHVRDNTRKRRVAEETCNANHQESFRFLDMYQDRDGEYQYAFQCDQCLRKWTISDYVGASWAMHYAVRRGDTKGEELIRSVKYCAGAW